MTEAPERVLIPSGVYWGQEGLNFYDTATRLGMGLDFFDEWQDRRSSFPTRADLAPHEMEGE